MPTLKRRFLHAAASSALFAGIAMTGCQSISERTVTPISVVVESAKSGAGSEVIINQIRASGTTYALRGSDFANLAERGVPAQVLDELQQRFFSDVESLTTRWYRTRASGGPTWIYPQPLDLDNLDRGGDGMAPNDDVGRPTHGTRPAGVPEWVPPFPAAFGQFISASTLLEMTNSGLSEAEMIEKIMNSRVRPLYAPGSDTSNARLGAITGSTFASLVLQGVQPRVVDALQAINIAEHVESTRFGSAGGGY